MQESGYYPTGAEFDPDAPYNEKEPETTPVTFIVYGDVSQEVTIEVPIDTDPWEYRDLVYEYINEDNWSYPNVADIEMI